MFIKAKVKDFQAWKKVYDEAAGLRASFGGGADQVFQDTNDRIKHNPSRILAYILISPSESIEGLCLSSRN
jgi:hypothetical protein